jgi:hypothetical protein
MWRINRSRRGFCKEAFVYHRFASPTLPIPEIDGIDDCHFICISRRAFGSYNLMTDRRRITAVIDWDRALFGDPLYELANLLFWRRLQPTPSRLRRSGCSAISFESGFRRFTRAPPARRPLSSRG